MHRPPNAFIIYRKEIQARLTSQKNATGSTSPWISSTSTIAGRLWKAEDPEIKAFFIGLSKVAKQVYDQLLPCKQNCTCKPKKKRRKRLARVRTTSAPEYIACNVTAGDNASTACSNGTVYDNITVYNIDATANITTIHDGNVTACDAVITDPVITDSVITDNATIAYDAVIPDDIVTDSTHSIVIDNTYNNTVTEYDNGLTAYDNVFTINDNTVTENAPTAHDNIDLHTGYDLLFTYPGDHAYDRSAPLLDSAGTGYDFPFPYPIDLATTEIAFNTTDVNNNIDTYDASNYMYDTSNYMYDTSNYIYDTNNYMAVENMNNDMTDTNNYMTVENMNNDITNMTDINMNNTI
ncbi:1935_t:CDS:1 [Paraglomus occultum]|uniref:1935_t:CDS:1 n=1 Tax=Paraglomus occultum TaxID=144539 RepID=A0A9N9BWN1_9GLOM|nr:1935_t:CDS:1 [Paraglomus occultum]